MIGERGFELTDRGGWVANVGWVVCGVLLIAWYSPAGIGLCGGCFHRKDIDVGNDKGLSDTLSGSNYDKLVLFFRQLRPG